MVARDPDTGKAAEINPLLPETPAEKKLFQLGEESKQRRKTEAARSLDRIEPTGEEVKHIHQTLYKTGLMEITQDPFAGKKLLFEQRFGEGGSGGEPLSQREQLAQQLDLEMLKGVAQITQEGSVLAPFNSMGPPSVFLAGAGGTGAEGER